jgi:signal transduction histidine kinase
LAATIEWQAQQFEAKTGIVSRVEPSLETVNLTRDQSTAVFRILQEALTNVIRHAHATRVEITMTQQQEEFVLTIRDDGAGVTANDRDGVHSLGILGMKERAHLAGGTLEIGGAEDGGTVVTLRLSNER